VRVVVTVQHPAHVHFFRHAVAELESQGHEVAVFAREKEVVVDLLRAFDIDHEVLAGPADSLASLAVVQCAYEARLLARARRFEPDVIAAVGGVAAAHVGALLDVPSVLFYDTEHASLVTRLAFPFADAVWTPDSYEGDVGRKHWRYPGFHELAYLHPSRFRPDPTALDGLDVGPDDPYVVLRLGSWDASHDVGQGGFADPRSFVAAVEGATDATVLVSAESALPAALEPARLPTSPERVHHLLAYADAVVSEGATMAAESAVLGTPAVYVSTLGLGYLDALADRYGLLTTCDGPDRQAQALERTVELLAADPARWRRRRARLLDETVDTTDVILEALARAVRPLATPP